MSDYHDRFDSSGSLEGMESRQPLESKHFHWLDGGQQEAPGATRPPRAKQPPATPPPSDESLIRMAHYYRTGILSPSDYTRISGSLNLQPDSRSSRFSVGFLVGWILGRISGRKMVQ